MNNISFATLIVTIASLFMNSCQNEDQINKLTKREIEDEWQLLFDGKTTNGWRLFKGEQGTGY